MVGKVALLAALGLVPLHATELCTIVSAAELMVIAKLNDAKYSTSPKPARITGRLHIAGVVRGTRPDSTQVDYDFDCSRCRELEPRYIEFVSKEYGIWFLRKDGDVWTSAFPRSTDPGYQPLDTLEHYKTSCLQGRRLQRWAAGPIRWASGASGHVYEPFLEGTPRPNYLFSAYYEGRTLAAGYYLAIPFLSWMNVVVGDPLCGLSAP